MTEPTGRKNDTGKARYDLIPVEALEALAELYGVGAVKYADRNWELGMRWGRVFRAMMSHAWKWWRGQRFDEEDGQHHLTSVAWCAFALYIYERRRLGEDDRVKVPAPLNPRIEENLRRIEERTPACPDLDQELPVPEQRTGFTAAELVRSTVDELVSAPNRPVGVAWETPPVRY